MLKQYTNQFVFIISQIHHLMTHAGQRKLIAEILKSTG